MKMNKYNGLLLSVSQKHAIFKGKTESEIEWKVRIIYSICGMMAYASLWDDSSEELVSINHIKHRITTILSSYKQLYPEVNYCFPIIPGKLENEIAEIFLKNGILYHRPNRVCPAKKCTSLVGNVCFQRGISIDGITNVSGTGFYSLDDNHVKSISAEKMFAFDEISLDEQWKQTISQAKWNSAHDFDYNTEYLKMEPPFTRGYWTNNPYRNGNISILRTGVTGSKIYYLYRYIDDNLEISALPAWQVDEHRYRSLANACLYSKRTLPCIDYTHDGTLVHLRLNYLLPPRELNFIKLYSWPENCASFPSDFKRKLSTDIFDAIKIILSKKGYTFIQR